MLKRNNRLDPNTFSTARQESCLQAQLDQGGTLFQRRSDDRWVERRGDGEKVLPIQERPDTVIVWKAARDAG